MGKKSPSKTFLTRGEKKKLLDESDDKDPVKPKEEVKKIKIIKDG
jgi:hypothetical protein